MRGELDSGGIEEGSHVHEHFSLIDKNAHIKGWTLYWRKESRWCGLLGKVVRAQDRRGRQCELRHSARCLWSVLWEYLLVL